MTRSPSDMENELPATALGILRVLMTTQSQVDSFSDQIIEAVKSGEVNSLEILIQLRAFERASERIIKETKDNYLKEANAYPEASFDFHGATVTKADTRTSYDYSACNDPVWGRLKSVAEASDNQLKERELFLKSIKNPITIVDESTGEIVNLLPPKVARIAGLKISIK